MPDPHPDIDATSARRQGDKPTAGGQSIEKTVAQHGPAAIAERVRQYCQQLLKRVAERRGWSVDRLEDSVTDVTSVLQSIGGGPGRGAADADSQIWPLMMTVALRDLLAGPSDGEGSPGDSGELHESLARGPSAGDAELVGRLVDELVAVFPPARQEIVSLVLAGHDPASIARRAQVCDRTIDQTIVALNQVLNDAIEGAG